MDTEIKADVTGVILAGGAGRRVGNRDKGLLSWHGKPLVAHVSERISPQVGCLVISCNRNQDIYGSYCDVIISDERQGFEGPLSGLASCAPHIHTPYLFLAACDMPRVPGDVAMRLLEPLLENESNADISYVYDGVRDHYLCAALKRDCLDSLASYLNSGKRTVRDWYATFNAMAVDFSDEADAFANLNTLEAFEELD